MDNSVESVEKVPSDRAFAQTTRYGLGIFAKEPLPGRVKTRLCPPLSAQESAALYRVSLEETVALAAGGPWTPVLFYEGRKEFFADAFGQLPLCRQQGRDLGERMEHALTALLRDFDRAVLIGSDTPDLPTRLLRDAFAALESHDLVLGPASDGGYVLIGERIHHPPLFRDIPWSTPQVLKLTRERAREEGLALAETALWDDVDDFASLLRLLERSPESRTARFVREHIPTAAAC